MPKQQKNTKKSSKEPSIEVHNKQEAPVIKKRRRRRKNGDKKSSPKLYFSSDTQDAIVRYQKEESVDERNKIFTAEIYPAFDKLSENLIRVNKFNDPNSSYEELKQDCVTFLYEKIYNFNADKGTNAFSYFNVVGKNFLMYRAKTGSTYTKRHESIEDVQNDSFGVCDKGDGIANTSIKEASQVVDQWYTLPSQEEIYDKKFAQNEILRLLNDLEEKVKSEKEKNCLYAIKFLFEQVQEIENLTKKAIFSYLRQISGLKSKQVITSLANLKKKYRSLDILEDYNIF